MALKIALFALSALAVAHGQVATSHTAVSKGNGEQYSYDISHNPPGAIRGSAHPHGYGGFGSPSSQTGGAGHQQNNFGLLDNNVMNRHSYHQGQYQVGNFQNRDQQNYQHSDWARPQQAGNGDNYNGQSSNYPVGVLLHRAHASRPNGGLAMNSYHGQANQQNQLMSGFQPSPSFGQYATSQINNNYAGRVVAQNGYGQQYHTQHGMTNQGYRSNGFNQGYRSNGINQGYNSLGSNQGYHSNGNNQAYLPVGINQGYHSNSGRLQGGYQTNIARSQVNTQNATSYANLNQYSAAQNALPGSW